MNPAVSGVFVQITKDRWVPFWRLHSVAPTSLNPTTSSYLGIEGERYSVEVDAPVAAVLAAFSRAAGGAEYRAEYLCPECGEKSYGQGHCAFCSYRPGALGIRAGGS